MAAKGALNLIRREETISFDENSCLPQDISMHAGGKVRIEVTGGPPQAFQITHNSGKPNSSTDLISVGEQRICEFSSPGEYKISSVIYPHLSTKITVGSSSTSNNTTSRPVASVDEGIYFPFGGRPRSAGSNHRSSSTPTPLLQVSNSNGPSSSNTSSSRQRTHNDFRFMLASPYSNTTIRSDSDDSDQETDEETDDEEEEPFSSTLRLRRRGSRTINGGYYYNDMAQQAYHNPATDLDPSESMYKDLDIDSTETDDDDDDDDDDTSSLIQRAKGLTQISELHPTYANMSTNTTINSPSGVGGGGGFSSYQQLSSANFTNVLSLPANKPVIAPAPEPFKCIRCKKDYQCSVNQHRCIASHLGSSSSSTKHSTQAAAAAREADNALFTAFYDGLSLEDRKRVFDVRAEQPLGPKLLKQLEMPESVGGQADARTNQQLGKMKTHGQFMVGLIKGTGTPLDLERATGSMVIGMLQQLNEGTSFSLKSMKSGFKLPPTLLIDSANDDDSNEWKQTIEGGVKSYAEIYAALAGLIARRLINEEQSQRAKQAEQICAELELEISSQPTGKKTHTDGLQTSHSISSNGSSGKKKKKRSKNKRNTGLKPNKPSAAASSYSSSDELEDDVDATESVDLEPILINGAGFRIMNAAPPAPVPSPAAITIPPPPPPRPAPAAVVEEEATFTRYKAIKPITINKRPPPPPPRPQLQRTASPVAVERPVVADSSRPSYRTVVAPASSSVSAAAAVVSSSTKSSSVELDDDDGDTIQTSTVQPFCIPVQPEQQQQEAVEEEAEEQELFEESATISPPPDSTTKEENPTASTTTTMPSPPPMMPYSPYYPPHHMHHMMMMTMHQNYPPPHSLPPPPPQFGDVDMNEMFSIPPPPVMHQYHYQQPVAYAYPLPGGGFGPPFYIDPTTGTCIPVYGNGYGMPPHPLYQPEQHQQQEEEVPEEQVVDNGNNNNKSSPPPLSPGPPSHSSSSVVAVSDQSVSTPTSRNGGPPVLSSPPAAALFPEEEEEEQPPASRDYISAVSEPGGWANSCDSDNDSCYTAVAIPPPPPPPRPPPLVASTAAADGQQQQRWSPNGGGRKQHQRYNSDDTVDGSEEALSVGINNGYYKQHPQQQQQPYRGGGYRGRGRYINNHRRFVDDASSNGGTDSPQYYSGGEGPPLAHNTQYVPLEYTTAPRGRGGRSYYNRRGGGWKIKAAVGNGNLDANGVYE